MTIAYIQYQYHRDCQIARDYLHGVCLYGKMMIIDLTKFTNIKEIEYFERSDKVRWQQTIGV